MNLYQRATVAYETSHFRFYFSEACRSEVSTMAILRVIFISICTRATKETAGYSRMKRCLRWQSLELLGSTGVQTSKYVHIGFVKKSNWDLITSTKMKTTYLYHRCIRLYFQVDSIDWCGFLHDVIMMQRGCHSSLQPHASMFNSISTCLYVANWR